MDFSAHPSARGWTVTRSFLTCKFTLDQASSHPGTTMLFKRQPSASKGAAMTRRFPLAQTFALFCSVTDAEAWLE